VEIVSFDAYHYNGGIIADGKTFPGDIGRKEPLKKPPPNRRTIQVRGSYINYVTIFEVWGLSLGHNWWLWVDIERKDQLKQPLPNKRTIQVIPEIRHTLGI
jgi:GH35 family endo-1,4-beta-xylanase